MKNNSKVAYADAASSAERGGVRISADEYNGFADIGTGGVLAGKAYEKAILRLEGDTDGSRDGYQVCDARLIVREASLSSDCLRRQSDGGVAVKVKRLGEGAET